MNPQIVPNRGPTPRSPRAGRPATVDLLPAYRDEAAESYDHRTAGFCRWRDLVIDEVPLHAGDRVVDVGCGTGLCFERIEERIGRTGQLVGIDDSAPMLAQARRRTRRHGWGNVRLVLAPADRARLSEVGDVAIFCAVHDILQSRAALTNILGQLRARAWVGAVGGQWAHPVLVSYNALIYSLHAPYVRDFQGFDRPWALLAQYLESMRVDRIAGGSGFCLVGRTREGIARLTPARTAPAADTP